MSRRNAPKLDDLKLNLSPPPPAPPRRSRASRSPSVSPTSSCISEEDEANNNNNNSSPEGTAARAMVVVGCPRCLMYVMLAEEDPKCPKCKSSVLLDVIHEKNTIATTRKWKKKN